MYIAPLFVVVFSNLLLVLDFLAALVAGGRRKLATVRVEFSMRGLRWSPSFLDAFV